jgi:hypothetical protein
VRSTQALEAIQKLSASGMIHLTQLIEPEFTLSPDYTPTASFQKFKDAIAAKHPHIIHFIGHGKREEGIGKLAFVGPDGGDDWKRDEEIVQAVVGNPNLQLVFLQACESALPDPSASVSGVARQLAHLNVPAVVAMQEKVENWVADSFAGKFYETLAKGVPVDLAVKEGVKALTAADTPAFGVPVLYLGSYARMITEKEKSDDLTRSAGTEGQGQRCGRCGTVLARPEQKVCIECGLRFVCDGKLADGRTCGFRYEKPLGKYCSECGRPIVQPSWQQETPEPARNITVPSWQKETPEQTGNITIPFTPARASRS